MTATARLTRDAAAGARRRNPPRVTYVIGTYPLMTTTFIDREVRGLQRLGVEVSVLAVRRPPADAPLSSDQEALRREVTYLLPITVRTVLTAHVKWLARHPARYLATLAMLLTRPHPDRRLRAKTLLHFGEGVCAADALHRAGPDELHAHFVDRAATIALIASRMLGIPYNVSLHAGADVFVEPVMLREKLQYARIAVTCTAHNKRYLAATVGAECAARITVVPHGVPLAGLAAPEWRARAAPPVILAVGQLTERKGLDHLVGACARLRDLGYDFDCRIVGRGPQRDDLARKIREAELGDHVTLWGARPHDQVLDEYAHAAMFVLPCVRARDGDVDGIPNVLLEAMAMRVPVVTSDLPAIREVVSHGDNGLLVGPGDEHALTMAMVRLLDGPDFGARLGARGWETVRERFDAKVNVRRLAVTLWPDVFAAESCAGGA
jgi:colanic acid/amylovoran biosynthesis glycosyltransferase